MKRQNRIAAGFAAVVLASVALVGAFSVSATGGGQTDPLITLSYLTQVVKPELLAKVDQAVAENEEALLGKVETAIEAYSSEMEKLAGDGAGGADYSAVTLPAGSLLCPYVGTEILLRTGSAKILAGGTPVMHNATTGVTLSIGQSLQVNNLYVVPMEGGVISAVTECTLLIRGSYTIV